uniref:Laminin N-terminal domain-containing protein n=1 Tax=Steinernema glaseri TaxID=37863 RepID=A0A1I7ZZQ3_9BILA
MKAVFVLLAVLVLVASASPPRAECSPNDYSPLCHAKGGQRPPKCTDGILSEDCYPSRDGIGQGINSGYEPILFN